MINKTNDKLSHVVLLGAGASKAVLPNGDLNGKKLPLMEELIKRLELDELLEKNGINPKDNFETIYTKLCDARFKGIKKILEKRNHDFFSSLVLPAKVTDYDRLLLSMRSTDAIFSFNWDPLLYDAFERNKEFPLPQIYFPHGNIRTDNILLYPIDDKDYFATEQIANSLATANLYLQKCFTITIFGYSSPSSDAKIVRKILESWFSLSERIFEHIQIIDTNPLAYQSWLEFSYTHNYEHIESFQDSRIARYPRRSCEALFDASTKGIPHEEFPLSQTEDLDELKKEVKKLVNHEIKEI